MEQQPVALGLRSDLDLEILSGLTPVAAIVKTPDATLTPGGRVSARESAPE